MAYKGDLGNKLKQARLKCGYMQKTVAEYIGISAGMLSNIEAGYRNITGDKLEKLLSLYGISEQDLSD